MMISAELLLAGVAAVVLLICTAAYCVLVSRNLVRILIGLEIFTKAVTLLIILGGLAAGRIALGQSLVITLIVVEVVVIVVAAGVVINSYGHSLSLDTRELEKLKG